MLTTFADYVSNSTLQMDELRAQMARMEERQREEQARHAAELANQVAQTNSVIEWLRSQGYTPPPPPSPPPGPSGGLDGL